MNSNNDEINEAIRMWKKAAFSNPIMFDICKNSARELEIERDTGKTVFINKRIS